MRSDEINVRWEVAEPETQEMIRKCVEELPGFAVGNGAPPSPGDILVREVEGREGNLEFPEAKGRDAHDVEVVLAARDPGKELLLQAMRAGVKELLTLPLAPEELRSALCRARARREKRSSEAGGARRGEIIDIIGSKGGVGTTTVAVNLAASLLQLAGKSGPLQVALMDMNLPYGEVPLFLDMETRYNWGEVFRDISRLDATYLTSVLTRRPDGLCVLAAPTQLDDLQMATPEAMAHLLSLMRSLFDVIIVDGGQYLDEVSLKVMETADQILLVAVQNLPCLANVKRFLQHFRQTEGLVDEKIRLVVNRHLKDCELTTRDIEEAAGKRSFWQIPNDYQATLSAINHGRTLAEIAPKSHVTKSIEELARTLVPAERKAAGQRHLFPSLGFLSRLGRA